MGKKYSFILTAIHLIFCFIIVSVFKFNPFIRGFIGDMIFMGLMFYGIKTFICLSKNKLLLFILSLAYLTEISQYFSVLDYFSFGNNQFLRIIFGATFDSLDLLAYTLGVLIIYFEFYEKCFVYLSRIKKKS